MKARLRWTTLGFFVSFVGCDAQLGVLAGNDGSGTGGPGNGLDGSMGDVKLREFNSLEELDGLCNQLGEGPHPGDAPLRRLTRAEYNATVSDLLGDNTRPADAFPPEARALGFFGVADGQTVTTLLAEGYQSAAKALAGSKFRLTRHRGEVIDWGHPATLFATVHPSAVLRSRQRDEDYARFVDDLRVAGAAASLTQ